MKNKIYPFLLGLSCIVIVALVSFKNSEKTVENEQMTIIVNSRLGAGFHLIYVSTIDKYETFKVGITTKEEFNYGPIHKKIEEYKKEGWVLRHTNLTDLDWGEGLTMYYSLEREKK